MNNPANIEINTPVLVRRWISPRRAKKGTKPKPIAAALPSRIANNTSFDQCYYPDSDKVWFSGTVAKGQAVGLTQVKPGFTTNYWQDEE